MPSFDSPETDPLPELTARQLGAPNSIGGSGEPALNEGSPPQGPADWSREVPSDDQLSDAARERIAQGLRDLAAAERDPEAAGEVLGDAP